MKAIIFQPAVAIALLTHYWVLLQRTLLQIDAVVTEYDNSYRLVDRDWLINTDWLIG